MTKVNTDIYILTYKNHNQKYTKTGYQGMVFTSPNKAKLAADDYKSIAKKNLRVARVTLEIA